MTEEASALKSLLKATAILTDKINDLEGQILVLEWQLGLRDKKIKELTEEESGDKNNDTRQN